MYIYKHSQPSFLSLCKPIQSNNIGKNGSGFVLIKKGAPIFCVHARPEQRIPPKCYLAPRQAGEH